MKKLIVFTSFLFVLLLSSQGWAITRTVTNCAESGPGSLSYEVSSASAGDEIVFDITTNEAGYSTGESYPGLVTDEAGNAWFRIIMTPGQLLINANNVYIDGTTQTREANNLLGPEVEIRGTGASGYGFAMSSNSGCTIEGLVINGFSPGGSIGINLDYCDSTSIIGNYIGTTASGEAGYGNYHGIYVQNGSSNNRIGDGTAAGRNIISGNTYGIYIINSGTSSNEVKGNYIGTTVSGEAALPNYDGIMIHDAPLNSIGGSPTPEGNLISGNTHIGVKITGSTAVGNVLMNNIVGLNIGQNAKIGNNWGIVVDGAGANQIGGTGLRGNTVAGNGGDGIEILESSGCQVLQNIIGTNFPSFSTGLGNSGSGILMRGSSSNCQNNIVGGSTSAEVNIICGNISGIRISGDQAANNQFYGNWIGVTPPLSGLPSTVPNSQNGILINGGAHDNIIGWGTQEANTISGNGQDGIKIDGASGNIIRANLIGSAFDNSGNQILVSNEGDGIEISNSANNNIIGTSEANCGNYISGNKQYGVNIDASSSNEVLGNYIGTNISGTAALPNNFGGVYLTNNSTNNKIGKAVGGGGNLISGNIGAGVLLAGNGVSSNEVLFNLIGTNVSGEASLPNTNRGIHIYSGAHHNLVGNGGVSGRNIISGNGGEGILIYDPGTNSNEVKGNFIGTKIAGFADLGNTGDGVYIYNGAQYNVIRSGNVISGNDLRGIYIEGSGTNSNEVLGNYIGTDKTGTAAVSNEGTGIRISNGAQFNKIGNLSPLGRNIISGNKECGMYIADAGTDQNTVLGNYIGTNASGTAALKNIFHGVMIDSGPQHNIIGDGSPAGMNLISGNQLNGVYINDSSSNEVAGNYIGVNATADAPLANAQHGIFIDVTGGGESKFNRIGTGNRIAFNNQDGVRVEVTSGTNLYNTITQNSIMQNSGRGIELINGGNNEIPSPEVTVAEYNQPAQTVHLTGTASANAVVEFFGADNLGQGSFYAGTATADATGSWETTIYGVTDIPTGTAVTATQTDISGNTSEFGPTKEVAFIVVNNYQVDNMIGTLESGADYAYPGVYETIPATQVKTRSVATNETASFYFKLWNSGNATNNMHVSAEAGGGQFGVRYFLTWPASDEITGGITGEGSPMNNIPANVSFECRADITYSGTATATKEIVITFNSTSDASKIDSVKGIATFLAATPPPPPPPTSEVDHFVWQAPATAVAGQTFTATMTAYNAAGSIEPNVTGTINFTVDDGLVTPESIPASYFVNGVASGPLSLSKVGLRRVTALNGTAAGTAEILVTNATREYTSAELGIPGMTISMPAGATTQDVTVTVSLVTTPPGDAPPGYYIGGSIFDIKPNGTTFLIPVTVTIPITGPLAAPKVYYWNGTAWSTDGIIIVSYTDTSLTFTTTHFTPFAPMAASSTNLVRFGPNPYNPSSGTNAHIWYWLNSNAETSVYIIDLSGTVVWKQSYASSANGGKQGENNITFDGKTAWGDALGNGVYIYKIVQGGKSIGGGKIAIIK